MNSIDHINQISQELYGKQSYTITLEEARIVCAIFTEERAKGTYRYASCPLN